MLFRSGSGYMYLCASYYQGYFPDRDYRFFNRGVGGHALGDLAARWQEDVIDLRPDVLSVCSIRPGRQILR